MNAHFYNSLNCINYTGYKNGFLTRYAYIIITIYGYDVIRGAILIATPHAWTY